MTLSPRATAHARSKVTTSPPFRRDSPKHVLRPVTLFNSVDVLNRENRRARARPKNRDATV
jgi:hypothetical protein